MKSTIIGGIFAVITGNLIWILLLTNLVWLLVKDHVLFSWYYLVVDVIVFTVSVVFTFLGIIRK